MAISYCDFVKHVGVKLEPAQHVLCLVGFDGVDPVDLPPKQREIARQLFGDVDRFTAQQRRTFVVVIGGRSGKTYLLIALRALHLALTVDISRLAPGEVAYANIVAPDLDLAGQALAFVRGVIKSQPALQRVCESGEDEDSKSPSITLTRDGRRVCIKVRAASGKGGRTGRGRSLVFFGMDEAALFFDSDYKVNDEEVFKANTPRVMMGGQSVVASTPYTETGLLYDAWRENFGTPKTMMVAHAPTRLMRTDETILGIVDAAYIQDAENAEREYGAKFTSAGPSQFFDPATLAKATDKTIQLAQSPRPGAIVRAGVDAGFTRNSSTIFITHEVDRVLRVADYAEWKPTPGQPLKPSEVVASWATLCERHGARGVCGDQHHRESLQEHLATHGLWMSDAPNKADSFVHMRTLMREGRLKIPDEPRLQRQLRSVQSRPISGGSLSVTMPQARDGSHGDLVSALVLACWGFSGKTIQAPEPSVGTAESTAAAVERIRKQLHQERIGRGGRGAWMRGLLVRVLREAER